MATEKPKYNVTEKTAPFELRAYAPQIIAETIVSGDLAERLAQGLS